MIEMAKHAPNGVKTTATMNARTPAIATAIAETTGQTTKAVTCVSGKLAASRLGITVVAVVAIYAMLMASAKTTAATMTTMPCCRSEVAINTLHLIYQ